MGLDFSDTKIVGPLRNSERRHDLEAVPTALPKRVQGTQDVRVFPERLLVRRYHS